MRRRIPALVTAAAAALLALSGSPGGDARGVAAQGGFGFTAPKFVDTTLGGGEPLVAYSPVSKRLVYTSHEGTTHIFSSNLPGAPAESAGFVGNYRNQVNIWTSADGGATWQVVNYLAGFFNPPTNNTGFSDPDLTTDEGGRIYNTGIDLANDALFSSADGGRTWNTGTFQCHQGDRPWLAGGKKDEAFLATNTETAGHEIFHSTNGGASCASNGIADPGGVGKLFYDHLRGQLVEPAILPSGALGVAVMTNASNAYGATPGTFTQYHIADTTIFAHWPSMSIDSAGNYYMVWDTDPRQAATTGGCGSHGAQQITGNVGLSSVQTESPLANSILMSTSHDGGHHWTPPMTVAHTAGHRVLWPWVTSGDAGNAAVVWYEYGTVTDPNCGTGDVTIGAAEIFGALSPSSATTFSVNASGRAIHTGAICQGGTFCALTGGVTGEDRRLGDFFTVGTDDIGCVLVASADTTRVDAITGQPSPISHPIFMRQNSGQSLTGNDCTRRNVGPTPSITATAVPTAAATATPSSTPTPGLVNTRGAVAGALPLIGAAVAAGALVGAARRRRRRRPR